MILRWNFLLLSLLFAGTLWGQEALIEGAAVQAQTAALRAETARIRSQAESARQESEKEYALRKESYDKATSAYQALLSESETVRGVCRSLQQELSAATKEVTTAQGLLRDFAQRYAIELDDDSLPWALSLIDRKLLAARQALPEEAEALTPDGLCVDGWVRRFGPLLFFANDDYAGPVFQESGSALPRLRRVSPDEAKAIAELVKARSPEPIPVPVDLFGGAGFRARAEHPTLWGHFLQGGPVMIPIGILAWICLALFLERVFFYARHTCRRTAADFREEVLALPMGSARRSRVLELAATHIRKARRGLSVLAVTATIAPLLGLLGTVTGMIRTFRQIALFGTGDAQMLSGGISEALITTEAGLLLAIPALLFHAWCVRRNRRLSALLERVSEDVAE